MILKVVGQVKGHKNKMTMTLDVEALRNSLIKSKLTSKKIKTMANKSTRLANTKKWGDFKDFFEKKAEIENKVSEVVSWTERTSQKKNKKNPKKNTFWDFKYIYINVYLISKYSFLTIWNWKVEISTGISMGLAE